ETALCQVRALGLAREDFTLTSDGTNALVTIRPSGFGKLAAPVDQERAKLVDDILALKRGDQDEDGWTPKGAAPGRKADGQYVGQQRAIKALVRAKRMALALGAGSGKTGVTINAFTHLHETPGTGVKTEPGMGC
ncbi:MAG: hypothetical protein AAF629_36195, partial [Chloroflexota bacterium]